MALNQGDMQILELFHIFKSKIVQNNNKQTNSAPATFGLSLDSTSREAANSPPAQWPADANRFPLPDVVRVES